MDQLGFLGWIDAFGHGQQLFAGHDPGLLDREEPIAPDDDASAAAVGIAVLHDEAFQACRRDPDTEAFELAVLEERLQPSVSNLFRF